MAPRESVDAAVAVVQRADGRVLLGQRPAGKSWAGWWEFPGGKIEPGETPGHALQRELYEELGIETHAATPWLTRHFDYPERAVRLHFFMVRHWHGTPHGKEGQCLSWEDPAAPGVGPLLPPNAPVLAALQLPPVYAITQADAMGEQAFLCALQRALERGLRLVQIREKSYASSELAAFAARVITLCHAQGARAMLNGTPELAREVGADGVHLSAARLGTLLKRPDGLLCGASCHTAAELAHAGLLGLDFAVLAPVMPTLSHPEARPLGWDVLADRIAGLPLPVYALGGLRPEHLEIAWAHGAHGIAMQRAVWAAT